MGQCFPLPAIEWSNKAQESGSGRRLTVQERTKLKLFELKWRKISSDRYTSCLSARRDLEKDD